MPVADLVEDTFAVEPLRAMVAARGVLYAAMGPRSAGTSAVLLMDSAGSNGGAAGQTVFARGGPGALAQALASAARAAGVEIRTGAPVARITSADGRTTGVALAAGEEISAPIVVAAIEPKRLLTDLVDPMEVGPTLRWRAGNYRTPGVLAKVNLALARLPRLPRPDDESERPLRGRIVIASTVAGLERAFDASKYGRISEAHFVEATITSLIDPAPLGDAARASAADHLVM